MNLKKNPNELYNERKAALSHFTHSYDHAAEGGHGEHAPAAAHGGEHAAPAAAHAGTKTEEDWQQAYRENGTLYPNFEFLGMKWGMSIDLSSCVGCGSCTIACQAENNVSVVGKKQILMVHDMHWIRIDRYFAAILRSPILFKPCFNR